MKTWLAVLALIIMSACGDDSSSTTADDPKDVDMGRLIDANMMVPDVDMPPDHLAVRGQLSQFTALESGPYAKAIPTRIANLRARKQRAFWCQ